jgi:hypothetical protein
LLSTFNRGVDFEMAPEATTSNDLRSLSSGASPPRVGRPQSSSADTIGSVTNSVHELHIHFDARPQPRSYVGPGGGVQITWDFRSVLQLRNYLPEQAVGARESC